MELDHHDLGIDMMHVMRQVASCTHVATMGKQHLELKHHLGIRVSATTLRREPMHMLHNSAQRVAITVVAAEAANSICQCVNADQRLGEALSGLYRVLGARRA